MSEFFAIIPVYTAGRYIVISIAGMAFFILWEGGGKECQKKKNRHRGQK